MRSARFTRLIPLLSCVLLLAACVPRQTTVRTSTLDFLYPEGKDAVEASDVTLQIPVRVGIAFVPGAQTGISDPLPESERQTLLGRVADAFEARDFIASIEVIPSTYLQTRGGFDNLDQLKAAFGIDLVTLVSYEQVQFTTTTGRSIAYWTIVGAYLVNGEKNETSTMLEAVVYDIPSRALLFRGAGTSQTGGRAKPVGSDRKVREIAVAGFDEATDSLIEQLDEALAAFEQQAQEGTVRGVGTPSVQIVDAETGEAVSGGGAIAVGVFELALIGGLAAGAGLLSRRRRNAAGGRHREPPGTE